MHSEHKLKNKTLEYQEIFHFDIEEITNIYQQVWILIYEVIHDDYFKVVKLFPREFLDQYKKPN